LKTLLWENRISATQRSGLQNSASNRRVEKLAQLRQQSPSLFQGQSGTTLQAGNIVSAKQQVDSLINPESKIGWPTR